MGNETKCEIVGIGDVELETSIGCKLVLKDVRYVPEMRFSLTFVGKLDYEGYHSHIEEGKWKLTKVSLILARGKKKNTLYKIEARLVKKGVNIVENEASTKLWHKRLCHMSEKGFQVLARKKLLAVKGMSLLPCTHCLSRKQSRVAFRRFSSHRKPNILDLVHIDVC